MTKVIEFLLKGGQGKTYIVAGLVALLWWANTAGLLPDGLYERILDVAAPVLTYTVGIRLVRPGVAVLLVGLIGIGSATALAAPTRPTEGVLAVGYTDEHRAVGVTALGGKLEAGDSAKLHAEVTGIDLGRLIGSALGTLLGLPTTAVETVSRAGDAVLGMTGKATDTAVGLPSKAAGGIGDVMRKLLIDWWRED